MAAFSRANIKELKVEYVLEVLFYFHFLNFAQIDDIYIFNLSFVISSRKLKSNLYINWKKKIING